VSVDIPIILAVEDLLSETVLRRILQSSSQPYAIGPTYGLSGFGYLKKRIMGFNNAAKGTPFFVLTDLDNGECAPKLISEWFSVPIHENLIFRVAVREVESWLMADAEGFSSFLGIPRGKIPRNIDDIADPKETLIRLASHSRRRKLRDAIVPRTNSTAKQGPDYNGVLSQFVDNHWNIREAGNQSPSLHKALRSIDQFSPSWPNA
jgi:hypothetical protein